jgi:hypothetical protein
LDRGVIDGLHGGFLLPVFKQCNPVGQVAAGEAKAGRLYIRNAMMPILVG